MGKNMFLNSLWAIAYPTQHFKSWWKFNQRISPKKSLININYYMNLSTKEKK